MKKVSIREAKTKLSALIVQVERLGDKVTICRYGRPVAELKTAASSSTTSTCLPERRPQSVSDSR